MMTKVVNLRTEKYDIYIGRKRDTDKHFGNPFTHLDNIPNTIKVKDRDEAVDNCKIWLDGHDFRDVEPSRREWVLEHLHLLEGKRIGCYCAPLRCHGDVYKEILEKEKNEDSGNRTQTEQTQQ